MSTRFSTRVALLGGLLLVPVPAGCDVDKHDSATGRIKETGLTPNEGGPNGSGSIFTDKENAGGPGAPGDSPAKQAATPAAPAEAMPK